MTTLHLLLSHQPPAEIAAMVAAWERCVPAEMLLLAYGGSRHDFGQIAHPHKVFVEGPRLRTSDHQREKQSYSGVYSAAAAWMQGRHVEHVYFAEFDHIPLVDDLNARQIERLHREQADVMGHRLRRVDGTNYPNALYHAADPRFADLWRQLSRRPQPEVVLRMTGTGTLWTRKAFEAVASRPEPFPIYLEIYLPTLAHHLGFRVRDWDEQNRFVSHLGDFTGEIERARSEGAWSLHPVKQLWNKRVDVLQAPGAAQMD
ncbi:MAG: hypothetical protein V4710_03905 [Verrucomicrobiota bacterium]